MIEERIPIGYDAYTKDPLYEGDDIVRYRGKIYLRENFVQASLGTKGEIIDPDENEE
jgi:hypothetical protein